MERRQHQDGDHSGRRFVGVFLWAQERRRAPGASCASDFPFELAMWTLLRRLVSDERAQDTIEYVLLTAAIAFVSLATWPGIEVAIRVAYEQLDTQTQDLWEPPAPGGGS